MITQPLEERLNGVLKKIRQGEEKAGRDENTTQLIVVSKTFEVEDIQQVLDLGHRVFGETGFRKVRQNGPCCGKNMRRWSCI